MKVAVMGFSSGHNYYILSRVADGSASFALILFITGNFSTDSAALLVYSIAIGNILGVFCQFGSHYSGVSKIMQTENAKTIILEYTLKNMLSVGCVFGVLALLDIIDIDWSLALFAMFNAILPIWIFNAFGRLKAYVFIVGAIRYLSILVFVATTMLGWDLETATLLTLLSVVLGYAITLVHVLRHSSSGTAPLSVEIRSFEWMVDFRISVFQATTVASLSTPIVALRYFEADQVLIYWVLLQKVSEVCGIYFNALAKVHFVSLAENADTKILNKRFFVKTLVVVFATVVIGLVVVQVVPSIPKLLFLLAVLIYVVGICFGAANTIYLQSTYMIKKYWTFPTLYHAVLILMQMALFYAFQGNLNIAVAALCVSLIKILGFSVLNLRKPQPC